MLKKEIMEKIEKIADKCSSLKELGEKTGYGRKTLSEVLEKNPMFKNRILGKLKNFVEEFEDNKEIQFPEGNKLIVLDASVIRAKNLMEAIDLAIKAGFIFILTSVTIRELDRKQEDAKSAEKRDSGLNAQRLLTKAVKEVKSIIPVEIPEVSVNPDDDIINAIKNKKENIILWSGDKAMVLKARMHQIRNIYIEDEIKMPKPKVHEKPEEKGKETAAEVSNTVKQQNEATKNEPKVTIFGLRKKPDGKLYFYRRINHLTTRVEIYDAKGNSKSLTEPLEIGDTVLSVNVRHDFSSVYVKEEKLIQNTTENNAIRLFGKRAYDLDKPEQDLPEKYVAAVKRFFSE